MFVWLLLVCRFACPLIRQSCLAKLYELHVQIKNSWNICYRQRHRPRRLHWIKTQDQRYEHAYSMHANDEYRRAIWFFDMVARHHLMVFILLHSTAMYVGVIDVEHTHTLAPNHSRLPSNIAIILWALDDYYYAHCRKYVMRKPKTNIIMDISCYPFVTVRYTHTHSVWHATFIVLGIYLFDAIPCI